MHNHREIKGASGEEKNGEADVLFWNSWGLKISSSLDSHGDWLGAELVACERRGDRSATKPPTRTILRQQTGASAADDSHQPLLMSRKRVQNASFSSSAVLMLALKRQKPENCHQTCCWFRFEHHRNISSTFLYFLFLLPSGTLRLEGFHILLLKTFCKIQKKTISR